MTLKKIEVEPDLMYLHMMSGTEVEETGTVAVSIDLINVTQEQLQGLLTQFKVTK